MMMKTRTCQNEDGDASDSEDEMDIDVKQLPCQAVELEIDSNININAQVLKDMVSADPIAIYPHWSCRKLYQRAQLELVG